MVALVTDIILSWKATAIVSLLRLHPGSEHCSGFNHVMDEPACYRYSYIHLGPVLLLRSLILVWEHIECTMVKINIESILLIQCRLVFFPVEIKDVSMAFILVKNKSGALACLKIYVLPLVQIN